MIRVRIGKGIIVQEPIMFVSSRKKQNNNNNIGVNNSSKDYFRINQNYPDGKNYPNNQNNQNNQNKQNNQNNQMMQNILKEKIKIAPKKKADGNYINFVPEKLQSLNKNKEYLDNIMNRFFPESYHKNIKQTIEEQEKLLNESDEIKERKKFYDILLSIDGINKDKIQTIISLNEKNKGNKINSDMLQFIKENKLFLIEKIKYN